MIADLLTGTSFVLPRDCDERLRRIHNYWIAIHPASGGLPGRQHLDPVDVPDLLPWLWLLDVVHDPLRFKYRLLGTEQVNAMGKNPIGRWLDEEHREFVSHSGYRDYVAVAERGIPAYRRGLPAFHTDKRYVSLQRLLLPLARDGGHVDMVLALTLYMRVEEPQHAS